MESTPYFRACMDQGYETSRCRQITSPSDFVRIWNRNFRKLSTRNGRSYSPSREISKNVTTVVATGRALQVGSFQIEEITHGRIKDARRICQRCKVKVELFDRSCIGEFEKLICNGLKAGIKMISPDLELCRYRRWLANRTSSNESLNWEPLMTQLRDKKYQTMRKFHLMNKKSLTESRLKNSRRRENYAW